jgi:glycosyltransferase involved in cell wall biosynthesis
VTPRLKDAGHEVFISAFHGLAGAPSLWNDIPVLPAGLDPYGNDIIAAHAKHVQSDVVIAHMDAWVLNPDQVRGLKMVNWAPVDCAPLSSMDSAYFQRSGAIPVAVSRFGKRMLEQAGFTSLYVPHAIDTSVFTPPDSKQRIREEIGLPADAFIVGINAANKDAVRKSFPEQLLAFSRFAAKHPDAFLVIHALTQAPQALNLMDLVNSLDLQGKVRFSDPYGLITGRIMPENMAAWYGAIDVLSSASHAEGFGIPVIEAQSCGRPVIVTNFSSMAELRGAGWMVSGEPFWNAAHHAWWSKPRVAEIEACYELAYTQAASKEKEARDFALAYDVDRVFKEHWVPALSEIAEM